MLRAWLRSSPGTRPQCWWRYESPEPLRRAVRGRAVPAPWPAAVLGIPTHLEEWSPDLEFESQATFLARHRLLSTAERARLGAADYAAEPWRHPVHDTPAADIED